MEIVYRDLKRYARHISLEQIGIQGVCSLKKTHVLIVGVGGLGSPAAYYLAAAGVGHIGISESDQIEESNLQRQILYTEQNINMPKSKVAKERLLAINSNIKIKSHPKITFDNIDSIIPKYDFIVEGTDDINTKFLINDACVFFRKPFSHGGILQFDAQTFTYKPNSPCLRCLFPSPPDEKDIPTCSEAGVIGSIAGILGSLQATEAIKYICNAGKLLTGRMWTLDALQMTSRIVKFKQRDDCLICGKNQLNTWQKIKNNLQKEQTTQECLT